MYGEAATGKAMCVPLVTTVHHNCIYRTIDTRRLWLFFLLAKMLLGVMKHVAAETAAIFKMESCRRQAARLRLLSKVTNFTVHDGCVENYSLDARNETRSRLQWLLMLFTTLQLSVACSWFTFRRLGKSSDIFLKAVTVQTRVWNVEYQA